MSKPHQEPDGFEPWYEFSDAVSAAGVTSKDMGKTVKRASGLSYRERGRDLF
jgi:hypothetical protein